MKRLPFCFAVVCLLSAWSGRLDAAERPNFIFINIDDLGYADIGPFGSDNATPHLDRLAREGCKLTSFYAAPVCSPSRASLMTGCYPKRALPINNVLYPIAAVGLSPNEVTIAEVLRDAGYATACIGKWHLGDQPEFLPTRQGFDTYFGLPYSNDMGPADDGSKNSLGEPQPTPKKVDSRFVGGRNPATKEGVLGALQPPLPLLEADKVIDRVRADEQLALTRQYTQRAVNFIHEHKDQPFFLYLPHTAVHFPHYPAADFQGKSPHGLIGDWIEEVDASVGQVLDAVREAKIDDRTLVIFTSDNGGSVRYGSNNSPLRGTKGETWEGGIRVCTIAWWPGKIAPATSTDAITSMMDILPTFAALADAQLPADRKLDGVDIWPVLAGTATQPPHDTFYYFRGLQLRAVRSGPWKLHLAVAQKKDQEPPPLRLYNLADDVGETTDVAAEHPDVVARLQSLVQAMDADLGIDGLGPGCRPLGRVDHPQPLIAPDGTVRADVVGTAAQLP